MLENPMFYAQFSLHMVHEVMLNIFEISWLRKKNLDWHMQISFYQIFSRIS